MRKILLLVAIALFHFSLSNAQLPELTASDKASPIQLQQLGVAVKIIGARSSTTFTMTFCNPSDKILEGNFVLPLPNGANITRYALDINGQMREAVPVEKVKATEVFESVEKRKIDPGLLEKTEGNVFRTRIYPIPAHGRRSIIIGYEQELLLSADNALVYHLPFTGKDTLQKFALNVDIQSSGNIPVVQSSPVDPFNLLPDNGRYCASEQKENIQPDISLTIRISKAPSDVEAFVQKKSGAYYFFVQSFLSRSVQEKPLPKQVTIIWDNSLSGLYRNTEKEIQLLQAYIKRLGNATLKLYTINHAYQLAGTFAVQNGQSDQLVEKLTKLPYDGGTDYSKIRLEQGGETLLFSDGLSTLSQIDQLKSNGLLYTINSSSRADYTVLRSFAENNGGTLVDLQSLSVEEAIVALTKQTLLFLGIKKNDSVTEHYPAGATPIQHGFSLAGKLTTPTATFTLQFGYGRKVAFEETVALNYNEYDAGTWDLSKLFAQKKIEELEKAYDKNRDQILALGKQYSIVTKNTSLLVLEDVMDYVRNEIEPPLELRSEYKRLLKERKEHLSLSRKDVLENAIDYAEELHQWWKTNYPIKQSIKKFTPPTIVEDTEVTAPADNLSQATIPVPSQQLSSSRIDVIQQEGKAEEQTTARALSFSLATVDNVVVTGYSTALRGRLAGVSVTARGAATAPVNQNLVIVDGKIATALPPNEQIKTIETLTPKAAVAVYGARALNGVLIVTTKDQKQSEPEIMLTEKTASASYLKTLANTPRSEQYRTYLQLRDKHLLNPTFYYDVANFFLKWDKQIGLQILTNLAELDVQNHELQKTFGFKLKELGEKDLALYTFKKILAWRPQEPQSYRDYALALADKGKYKEALDTLYLALTKEYNETVMENFEGIEEIIVTEIAHLATRYKPSVNLNGIRKELLQPMPVDIRVVMNWNMNDVDMDLWITDPAGEKCVYNNPKTRIGGRLSEDFTEGYGPEQFLLKKAIKGKYKIQVHYYGENSAKIAGKTTLLVEVYTNYAKSNEQRKLITLQLEGEEQEGAYVGEFVF